MGDRSGIDEQLSHPNNESQATLFLTTDLDLVSQKVKAGIKSNRVTKREIFSIDTDSQGGESLNTNSLNT